MGYSRRSSGTSPRVTPATSVISRSGTPLVSARPALLQKEPMRRLPLPSMLLLGVAAGAPQPPVQPVAAAPPPVQPAPPPPPAMAASAPGLGPSKNMGLNYDRTYIGVSAVNNSAGNTWSSGGSRPCVTEPCPEADHRPRSRAVPVAGFHTHRKCYTERRIDDDLQLWPGV